MMGQHSRSEALFYYFRREDQVPETHRLRLMEKHINFAFAREPPPAPQTDDHAQIGIPFFEYLVFDNPNWDFQTFNGFSTECN